MNPAFPSAAGECILKAGSSGIPPERDHPPHGGALLLQLGDGRKKALQASGKFILWQVVAISIEGKIPDETKEKTSRVKME